MVSALAAVGGLPMHHKARDRLAFLRIPSKQGSKDGASSVEDCAFRQPIQKTPHRLHWFSGFSVPIGDIWARTTPLVNA